MVQKLDSVFIEPEWYPIFSDKLVEVRNNSAIKTKDRAIARACMLTLELGVRFFSKGERTQLVFTSVQKRLLSQISEVEGLTVAQERFDGNTLREFEKFTRSKR